MQMGGSADDDSLAGLHAAHGIQPPTLTDIGHRLHLRPSAANHVHKGAFDAFLQRPLWNQQSLCKDFAGKAHLNEDTWPESALGVGQNGTGGDGAGGGINAVVDGDHPALAQKVSAIIAPHAYSGCEGSLRTAQGGQVLLRKTEFDLAI